MKRNYLLPHTCQRLGVWAGVAAVLFFVIYTIACQVIAFDEIKAVTMLSSRAAFTNIAYFIVNLLLCMAILLVAFSQERCEDEMIDAVRKSSVVSTAYGIFIIYILCVVASSINNLAIVFSQPINISAGRTFSDIRDTITDPVVIFVIYETVFRTRLSRLKKALKDEE